MRSKKKIIANKDKLAALKERLGVIEDRLAHFQEEKNAEAESHGFYEKKWVDMEQTQWGNEASRATTNY